jgi:transposase
MYDYTKLVDEEVFQELLRLLPTPKQKRFGRRRLKQEALLNGILQVLVNDVAWSNIAECGASGSSCWRYFTEIQRRGKLKQEITELIEKKTDVIECAIDSSTITSFRFSDMVGWDGKHKKYGTKVSLLTDKNGAPADVSFGKGSKHDLHFVDKHITHTAGKRKKVLSIDKGYTSIDLRRKMRQKGIRVNMETRKGDYIHKKGPKFNLNKEQYKVRFLVERTFGWLKGFRRLRIRRERHTAMFKAFVYLALIIMLVR